LRSSIVGSTQQSITLVRHGGLAVGKSGSSIGERAFDLRQSGFDISEGLTFISG
jgi:hypothetical protein